jgi:MFS family permease
MASQIDVPPFPQMEQGDPIPSPTSPVGHPLLREDLFPSDCYADNGVYWADLPLGKRIAFVNRISNSEALREIRLLASEFKKDPLQPIRDYFSRYVITGMGLFVEGYTLFSIGNLSNLFQSVWPACWKIHTECNFTSVTSIDYSEIVGIIIGQVSVGVIGDWIGRRWGLIQDATIMLLGTILLTGMWGRNLQGWIAMYIISIFIYGVGVGGEYPMTSTQAMEGAKAGRGAGDRLHRGRNVVLAFTMQGWGQLLNQAILIICLLIFHGGGNPPYGRTSTQWTFRLSFAFVGAVTLWLLYHRIYKLQFSDRQLRIAKRKYSVTGYDVKSFNLVMTHYWHRLLGTAGGWFCNDFFFYGNKIFQGVFIKIIDPHSTVFGGWLWNLLNIGVALVGYYMAAFLIDHKFYGRTRMQSVGFLAIFILFVIAASLYPTLIKPGAAIKVFQFIYFFSSFWNQFGPNSTTFLLAAEVYPAPIRATAHGISAACGKLGALAPAILYNYVGNRTKFWVVTWFGLVGWLVTVLFVPDTTGLDLQEQERYWKCIREGRVQDYNGVAIHPRHLSLWESLVLRRNRYYDPELDAKTKMTELRSKYEASLSSGANEDVEADPGRGISESVVRYFELEKLNNGSEGERSSADGTLEGQEKLEEGGNSQ